jgi:excisionase family DNA binding protein
VSQPWLSAEEIAVHLGVTKDTVYAWIADRGMPAHKVGRLWKFQSRGGRRVGAPRRREQGDRRDATVRIIDNVNDTLGDDLKAEIAPGAKVRIAASTFSIFAFEALRKELEQVELEFLFTAPSFVNGKATDKLRKERREFFIPAGTRGRVEPVRLGVRDQAPQQAHSARHRPGVRRVDP